MDIEVLQRALEREKKRRERSEQALESRSRELYLANEQLNNSFENLNAANEKLKIKHAELIALVSKHTVVTDDLKVASELHKGLLPQAANFGKFDAHGLLKPAHFVAGDIYDYYMLSPSVFAFYIVDVTGHGTAAAMVSYAVHNTLNPKRDGLCQKSLQENDTLHDALIQTMERLNKAFYNDMKQDMFFTMVYGLLDTDSGEYVLCQAGHPQPILCSHSDGSINKVGSGGFPVGLFKHAEYRVNTGVLLPGDKLFLYSDGVTDLCNLDGEEFGMDRFIKTIEHCKHMSLKDSISFIENRFKTWGTKEHIDDDISVLIIENNLAVKDSYISDPYKVSLSITNSLNDLLVIERAIENILIIKGFDNATIGSSTIAVSEAVSNLIKYGFSDDDVGKITVDLIVNKGDFTVSITENGNALPAKIVHELNHGVATFIDPTQIDIMDIQESGRGLPIMLQATKKIEYTTTDERNVMTLFF